MKENNNDNANVINSNENKNTNSIKDIINYFNYTKKNDSVLNKEKLIDINNSKNNLSKIYQNYFNNKEININNNIKINENKESNNIDKNIKKINENIYYHEIIKKKLINLKQNTSLFLDSIKKKLNNNYSFFSDNILNWVKKKDKKLSKILSDKEINDNILEYINKNIFDKIKQIFDIHETIFNSINDHFTLLNLFLGDNLIEFNCPLEEFILKNSNFILNSFFLSKINMESLCLSKLLDNKDLGELFKNYYSKKKEDILFKSVILKNVSKISKRNFLQINELKIKSLSCDEINKLYKKISKEQENNEEISNKIKNITLSDLDIYSSSIENLSKMNYLILEKIKIKNCSIPYKSQIIFQTFISKTSNLKTIKLESVKLTDKSLNDFIIYISTKKSLLDSIQCISFKDNSLYSFNFESLTQNGLFFTNLEVLDLSNNNIYNFSSKNFIVLPKLQILELSNNNFNNNLFFESVRKSKSHNLISFMVFMCKNIFLYNIKENNENYIKYINDNLINFNYQIKNINLSLLYNKDNCEELTKLFFSPTINFSLIELNLSYCGLNDNIFYSFVKNNFDLINLTKINLSYNLFTIKFFTFCSEGENIILEKIKDIDLSYNKVKYSTNNDLTKIYKYIDKHIYLKKIKLQNNELLDILKKSMDNNEYKSDIEQIINLCSQRNIKFVIQTELLNAIDNINYKNVFI